MRKHSETTLTDKQTISPKEATKFLEEVKRIAKKYKLFDLEDPNIVVFSVRNDGITAYVKIVYNVPEPELSEDYDMTINDSFYKD